MLRYGCIPQISTLLPWKSGLLVTIKGVPGERNDTALTGLRRVWRYQMGSQNP